ncbi:hypothetical protein AGMMS49965_13400 [Bacteroidia bacterium]|nr:hypothetical protein AGMMS49965_13400 [Bacteroidia bacterium]
MVYANGKQDYEKASEYFKKSKKDILGILLRLGGEHREAILPSLKPLLDEDSFFMSVVPDKNNNLDKYKEAYLLSILIISQLHIKKEKLVAYYTQKNIAEKLLLTNSKFRLNSINYSNDPKEGQTLLDYFWGENKLIHPNPNNGYAAFAGCFTFNHDSLNQFRLYGKEDNKECTGLSLVFDDGFFNRDAKLATQSLTSNFDGMNISKQTGEKEEKCALFRCIYIDPETDFVVSVGHKEEYLFKKEDVDKKIIAKYTEDIDKVLEKVRENLKELKGKIVEIQEEEGKDFRHEIIGQLLINLRYLTKHVAFKEEQECRIVRILPLNESSKKKEDKMIKIDDDSKQTYKQMYVDYLEVKNSVKKIYFGTKSTNMELFQDILTNKGLDIPCEKSKNPFA